MPITNRLSSFGPLAREMERGVIEDVYGWIEIPADLDQATFRQLLERKLSLQMEKLAADAMPEVKEALATSYAYRLTVEELASARKFYSTPPGQAFATVNVDDSVLLRDFLRRQIGKQIFRNLVALVTEVEQSQRTLEQVNRRAR
jgi:hypothetical protein